MNKTKCWRCEVKSAHKSWWNKLCSVLQYTCLCHYRGYDDDEDPCWERRSEVGYLLFPNTQLADVSPLTFLKRAKYRQRQRSAAGEGLSVALPRGTMGGERVTGIDWA